MTVLGKDKVCFKGRLIGLVAKKTTHRYFDGFGKSAIGKPFDVDFGGLWQRNQSPHILSVSQVTEMVGYGNAVV